MLDFCQAKQIIQLIWKYLPHLHLHANNNPPKASKTMNHAHAAKGRAFKIRADFSAKLRPNSKTRPPFPTSPLTQLRNLPFLHDVLLNGAVPVEPRRPAHVHRPLRGRVQPLGPHVGRRERQLDHAEPRGARLVAARRAHGARVLAHVGGADRLDFQRAVRVDVYAGAGAGLYHPVGGIAMVIDIGVQQNAVVKFAGESGSFFFVTIIFLVKQSMQLSNLLKHQKYAI